MTTWTPRPVRALRVGGERRDEGLALAGLHLGDLALVEDDRRPSAGRRSGASRASGASPRGPPRRPPGGRRRGRPGAARSPACGALGLEVAAAVRVVLRRARPRSGSGLLRPRQDLRADLVDPGPDLRVGLSAWSSGSSALVGVDERLEAPDLAVVGVDEAGQEAKHHGTVSIGVGARAGPRSPASRLGRATRQPARSGTGRAGPGDPVYFQNPEPYPAMSRTKVRAPSASQKSDRDGRAGRVHLRVRQPARRASGASAAGVRQSLGGVGARLEAALAVGLVELEGHRSPNAAGRRRAGELGRMVRVVGASSRCSGGCVAAGAGVERLLDRRPPRGASPG